MTLPLDVIILAAGQGTRMKSSTPKVLHTLAGLSLLERIYLTAQAIAPASISIVFGNGGGQVKTSLAHLSARWVVQEQQLGTAHAVQQALPEIADDHQVLVLYADVPMLSVMTLNNLIQKTSMDTLGLLTAKVANPKGLGRVLRNREGNIIGIVEEKDANDDQLMIHEIFSGIMLAPAKQLKRWVGQCSNDNAQQEYYLTDIVAMASQENAAITSVFAEQAFEVQGVNDPKQLMSLERGYQEQCAMQLLQRGVKIVDSKRFDLRGELQSQPDTTIDVNVIIEGKVSIGKNCYIGPNCILKDVTLADNVVVKACSYLEGCIVDSDCQIGPFARIRPGTRLSRKVHIGNFVEIKKAQIGEGSKANHLSYIGDATVGKNVNIGAGTITCNYDGETKHHTIIEDGAFIGSDTQLIAPVIVGKNAVIGAGATVRHDAPADAVTINDTKQRVLRKNKESQD